MVEKNGAPPSLSQEPDSTRSTCEIAEAVPEPAEAPVISEPPVPVVQQEEVKTTKAEKGSRFGKLFKKKEPPQSEAKTEEKEEKSGEDQADAGPPARDPESVSIDSSMCSEMLLALWDLNLIVAYFLRASTKKGWLGFLFLQYYTI